MKISSFLALCLLIISVTGCSFINNINNRPSKVADNFYACVAKKDADCILKISTDEFIANRGGHVFFKEQWSKHLQTLDTNNFSYKIKNEASTETTAEVKITIFNDGKLMGDKLFKLKKDNGGQWKLDDYQ